MKSISYKLLTAAALSLFAVSSHAATIATFNFGSFAQSGTVLNQYSANIIAFQIDLFADSGSPASPIWELPPIGSLGSPMATFTNQPHPEGAFTATWSGLNVANGSTFTYVDLDFGGWNGSFVDQGLIPNFMGDEVVTIFFGNGDRVSTRFGARNSSQAGVLVFDDADITRNAVPEPFTLGLMGIGLAGFALSRRKAKA